MRLLVVGGSAFVGRAIVHASVAAGHEVTVLNRGKTPSDLPSSVTRLVGDRSTDLTALADRSFDATVDVIAYRGSDVDRLADALGNRGGRHLQISSISAYRDPVAPGSTESTAALWTEGTVEPEAPIDGATYGPLKADAERAAVRRFGDAVVIVRPTFVIGAHDLTLRFPYWVARATRGGTIAVPGSPDSTLQYVDARDLAAFCVTLLETGATGAFHACGPFPQEGFVPTIRRVVEHVAPPDTTIVEVDPAVLSAEGLAGAFPLWTGADAAGALAMDPAKAVAAGLVLRPLEESVDEVLAWWGTRDWPDQWLSVEREAALLAAVDAG